MAPLENGWREPTAAIRGVKKTCSRKSPLRSGKGCPRFRGDSSERTRIYRVVHNVALTFTTKLKKRENREVPLGELPAEPQGDADRRRVRHLRENPITSQRIPSPSPHYLHDRP